MRFADLALRLIGATSGEQIIKAAAAASGAITLPAGTTDFSGAGPGVVKQASTGAAFTVAPVAATEVTGLAGLTADALIKGGGAGAAPVASTATVDASGNLTVTGGATFANQVISNGAAGGYQFNDRVSASPWYLYATGGAARLYATAHPGEVMTVDGSGNLSVTGALTVGNNPNPAVGITSTDYTGLWAPDGTGTSRGIFLSNATAAATSYYRNTQHNFGDISGATVFLVTTSNGTLLGNATGGGKGAGTINAVQVWTSGVQLTSDARLKRDIEALPDNCLDLVRAIMPKRFRHVPAEPEPISRMPGDPEPVSDPGGSPGFWERRNWGFIAQEVGAVMTAAGHDFGGHIADDGGPESLSYNDMTAVLWKALQEAMARIEALEARGAPTG